MVHVISVHNFASQHIQTVEQPTASACAPPQRLLLALPTHCIEVRDLSNQGELLFTFPTVDYVKQLLHCVNGNFVITVESKTSRQYKVEKNSVRVYLNWDSVGALQQSKMTSGGVSLDGTECGMVQPMRARIAGRVTPTTNHAEVSSLEMIEIPLDSNPTSIECCQISGNIVIISATNSLTFQLFQIKTHLISKLKFVDFEECPIKIELNFAPKQVTICENYVACLNSETVHVFKIVSQDFSECQDAIPCYGIDNSETIDYMKLLNNESLARRMTVNLPNVSKSNSLIHKNNPFTYTDKEIETKIIVKKTQTFDKRTADCCVVDLIQLRLRPLLIENAQNQIMEEFKCIKMKGLYVADGDSTTNEDGESTTIKKKRECRGNNDNGYFRSYYRDRLRGVSLFLTTQQEGYLYYFDDDDDDRHSNNNIRDDDCISVYPFTAPVFDVVMEDFLLHALTETGLESYTLRTGHRLCMNVENVDDVNVACPPIEDSICMVGLRPFLGVERMLLSEKFLVLLASSDGSPTHSIGSSSSGSSLSAWTLYTLELPSPRTIFDDVSIVANGHRYASPQTYCHLLSEAHMILRVSLLLTKWRNASSAVDVAEPRKKSWHDENDQLKNAYRTSCALLGDYYLMSEKYELSVPYYKMGGLRPFDVLTRAKKLQKEANTKCTKGLVHYFKTTLLNLNGTTDFDLLIKSGIKRNVIDEILDLFEKHNFEDVPRLVIKSAALREYFTTKFIDLLKQNKKDNKNESSLNSEKLLAMTSLHVQRCETEEAVKTLKQIKGNDLYSLLEENEDLLFDRNINNNKLSLSEFAIVLMASNSKVFADVLVFLIVEKRSVNINKILKLFSDYIPSRSGSEEAMNASAVLQNLLEEYLRAYFSNYDSVELPKVVYDKSTQEAVAILIRFYLSKLLLMNKDGPFFNSDQDERENYDNYLFSHLRREYLNKMPPFDDSSNGALALKKLQALLSSRIVPKHVLQEIESFLERNKDKRMIGRDTIEVLMAPTTARAIAILIEKCPESLLRYAVDVFNKTDDWKYLIATVQRKIIQLTLQDGRFNEQCNFYKNLLKEILTHVATSMSLEQLFQAFPQNVVRDSLLEEQEEMEEDKEKFETTLEQIQNYTEYVAICKETMHANQIQKLIKTTAHQLLCTLNL